MSKIGIHVITWNTPLLEMALETGPGLVKLMDNPDPDPIAKILAKWPNTIIVLRKFFDDWEQAQLLEGGIAGGQRCAGLVAAHFTQVTAVCQQYGVTPRLSGVNEPPLRPYDAAPAKLAVYTQGFAPEARRLSFVPLTLSLSVGQPEGTLEERQYIWDQLEPALAATIESDGEVEFHPYGRPPAMDAPDNPYYFNRPRWDRDNLWPATYRGLRFIYGETSLDGGTLNPPPPKEAAGWKSYVSAEELARQLRWAVAEIDADPGIIGMTPFTHGPTGDWDNFGLDGYPEIEAVYTEQAQGGTTVPKPTTITPANRPSGQPGGSAVFEFDAKGVDGTAKGFADVSHALIPGTDHSYYGPDVTTELPPFRDGHNTVTLKIPPATTPIPEGGTVGEIRFRLFELDGAEWDGGVHGPFPIDVLAEAQTPPAPQPGAQPPAGTVPAAPGQNPGFNWTTDRNLGAMTALYNAGHALEGNSDPKVAEIGARSIALLDWWKGGPDAPDPFVKKPATPK